MAQNLEQEENELQEVPEEQSGSGKGLIFWAGLGLGSFILVFVGTLLFLVYIGDPLGSAQEAESAALQASTTVETVEENQNEISGEEPALQDSVSRAEEQAEPKAADVGHAAVQTGEDVETPQSSNPPQLEETPVVAAETTQQNNQDTGVDKSDSPPSDQEESVDYKQLAKIYSQMDPGAAAKILAQLEDEMVVGILREMRDRNAAQLLIVFDSKTAARISRQLSQMTGES